jgi:hypothetical protein
MKFKTLFSILELVVKELTIVFALVTMFIISKAYLICFDFLCLFPDGSFQKLLKFESTIITGAKRKWFLISL